MGPAGGSGVAAGSRREVDAWRRLIPANEPAFFPDLGDGLDVWGLLSGENHTSPRTELLVETHAAGYKTKGLGDALTVGPWKIIRQNGASLCPDPGWGLLLGLLPTILWRVESRAGPSSSYLIGIRSADVAVGGCGCNITCR